MQELQLIKEILTKIATCRFLNSRMIMKKEKINMLIQAYAKMMT